MNIKNKLYGICILAGMTFTACTGDLNVTPIDPSTNTSANTLTSVEKYDQLLAKCYSALAVSSPDGNSGSPDIDGIDGGFGQYLRAYFNCQELPTDECVMGWNDQTVKDFHGLQWTSSDVFVSAMYYRVMYEVSLCNEVIRQINNSGIKDPKMEQYKAEARCIRALAYLHAIDLFGNVPFTNETASVGGNKPSQIKRADLFAWLETELKSLTTNDNLPTNPEKYRAGKGMAYMMLAKLYLNAKVYTGTAKYTECAEACKNILKLGYQLESQTNYFNMFGADNDRYLGVGHEIIFSVYQDHINTQAYGGTAYIINGETGGSMDYLKLMGLGGAGWGGLRVTPEFVDLFSSSDIRGTHFYTDGQSKEIKDIGTFTDGYAYYKFTNKKADGSNVANINSFTDTDFPVYRLADVYLMLAECQVVGGVKVDIDGHDGIYYFNEVRKRAGANEITSPTANDIIQERARELAWEGHRRSDLIRFGLLTSDTYLWSYKGMNSNTGEPHSVDNKYNLFPLPASEITANTNLTQNEGY